MCSLLSFQPLDLLSEEIAQLRCLIYMPCMRIDLWSWRKIATNHHKCVFSVIIPFSVITPSINRILLFVGRHRDSWHHRCLAVLLYVKILKWNQRVWENNCAVCGVLVTSTDGELSLGDVTFQVSLVCCTRGLRVVRCMRACASLSLSRSQTCMYCIRIINM